MGIILKPKHLSDYSNNIVTDYTQIWNYSKLTGNQIINDSATNIDYVIMLDESSGIRYACTLADFNAACAANM